MRPIASLNLCIRLLEQRPARDRACGALGNVPSHVAGAGEDLVIVDEPARTRGHPVRKQSIIQYCTHWGLGSPQGSLLLALRIRIRIHIHISIRIILIYGYFQYDTSRSSSYRLSALGTAR